MLSGLDIIIQLVTFAAVFGLAVMAQRTISGQIAVRRRLQEDASTSHVLAANTRVMKSAETTNRFLQWVASATSLDTSKDGGQLRRDLAHAGFESPAAPALYVVGRFSLAIGLPLLLIIGSAVGGKPLTGLGGIVFPLILCGIGLVAPKAVLDRMGESRRAEMEHEFPDALDLMVVCVEAGLGLEASFVRVSQEVRESHPRISKEFGALADELSAGRGRADALRALADRVNVDSVKSFVALLIQTDSLGVSIAQSLRTYSAEMRETRYLRAEEKAMRIPVLMTMPIVGCFMPVIIVALLLPPAIDVVRTLGPAMKGRPPVHATTPPPKGLR